MPQELPVPRASPSPSAYREKNPFKPPPPDYKPPSMLVEHKGLAALFAAVCIAFAVYCLKGPQRPRSPDLPRSVLAAKRPALQSTTPAAAPQSAASGPKSPPIYIEALPEKDAR